MSARQLKFKTAIHGWGGRRSGAGRPNLSSQVAHGKRPRVDFKKPLHITMKLRSKKWNLRCGPAAKAFKVSAAGAKKFGLNVLHYSILSDHIHLIVETKNNEDLARGMRSFGSRFGKAFRRILGGKGPVFAGRFHLRVIKNPSQMRNTLIYVLQNFAKHSNLLKHIDVYSSAGYFGEWKKLLGRNLRAPDKRAADEARALSPLLIRATRPPPLPDHLCAARSWLAREGWMRASLR